MNCSQRSKHKISINCCLPSIVKSNDVERPWRSGNVMNCHATVPGSIPGRDGVFTELHVLRKGQ